MFLVFFGPPSFPPPSSVGAVSHSPASFSDLADPSSEGASRAVIGGSKREWHFIVLLCGFSFLLLVAFLFVILLLASCC